MTSVAEDLLQRVLEGEASPEERARLDDLLAADPALRRRRDELQQALQVLGAARLAEPPAGLREGVLREIARHAADSPRRGAVATRRVPPAWARFLLPITAAAAAVALVWMLRPAALPPREHVSGTIGGEANQVHVLVGLGAEAVRVRGEHTPEGYKLVFHAGSTAGRVELSAGEGVTLRAAAASESAVPGTLEREFRAGEDWSVEAHTSARELTLQIRVRYQDGREASGRLPLVARRTSGPGG